MKISTMIATLLAMFSLTVSAQVAPTAGTSHADMLRSADSRIAANKKLVYDFWRTVIEARHVEQADNFVAADYVQHNPNIPTGRQAMDAAAAAVDFFAGKPPRDISPTIARPLITIVAEGDLVTLVFVQHNIESKDMTKKYATSWFDMFRIENGLIVEHWDSAIKS